MWLAEAMISKRFIEVGLYDFGFVSNEHILDYLVKVELLLIHSFRFVLLS